MTIDLVKLNGFIWSVLILRELLGEDGFVLIVVRNNNLK